MVACTFLALLYGKHELEIKSQIALAAMNGKRKALNLQKTVTPIAKEFLTKLRLALLRLLGLSRS